MDNVEFQRRVVGVLEALRDAAAPSTIEQLHALDAADSKIRSLKRDLKQDEVANG